jgi:hypothetical protein
VTDRWQLQAGFSELRVDMRHTEFGTTGAEQLIKRGVYTKAMWSF